MGQLTGMRTVPNVKDMPSEARARLRRVCRKLQAPKAALRIPAKPEALQSGLAPLSKPSFQAR